MNIRTVGVGLMAGGYFIVRGMGVVSYMKNQLQASPFVAWQMALEELSPVSANTLGGNLVIPLSWAFLCLGAGLFAAGIIWPLVEQFIFFAHNSVYRALVNKFRSPAAPSKSNIAELSKIWLPTKN